MMSLTDEKIWAKEMMLEFIDKGIKGFMARVDQETGMDEQRALNKQRERIKRFLGLEPRT